MKFLIDENVSLLVAHRLRDLGHEVTAVVESELAGTGDDTIFQTSVATGSVLITRDHHFTNNSLFPRQQAEGIIYIRQGNLCSEDEALLLEQVIKRIQPEHLEGKLLTVYKNLMTIR